MSFIKRIIGIIKPRKWISLIFLFISLAIVSFSSSFCYQRFDKTSFIKNENNYSELLYKIMVNDDEIKTMKFENGVLHSNNSLLVRTIYNEDNKPVFEFRYNSTDKNEAKVLLKRIYLSKIYNPSEDKVRSFSFIFFCKECYYVYIYKSDDFSNPEKYSYAFEGEFNSQYNGYLVSKLLGNSSIGSDTSVRDSFIKFMSDSYILKKNRLTLDSFLSSFLISLSFIIFAIVLIVAFFKKIFGFNTIIFVSSFCSIFGSFVSCFSFIVSIRDISLLLYLVSTSISILVVLVIVWLLGRKNEKSIN